jgi:uncharacterized damage-inducible protein DinB
METHSEGSYEQVAVIGGDMANEMDRIRDQIARAFSGGAWYGPTLLQALAEVDARTAAAHPIPGAHSIWEIVLHVRYGQQFMLNRLRGSSASWDLTADWPTVQETSEAAWQRTLGQLSRSEEELWQATPGFPEGRLDDPPTPDGTSMYNNLQGYAQHHAYHAGQIAILRRAAGAPL